MKLTPEQRQEQLIRIVKLGVAFNVALYSIDEFVGTPLYSHELKAALKHASKLIERKNSTLMGIMYKADEKTTAEALKEYEYVIDQLTLMIAKANVDDISAMYEGLQQYYKDKANENNTTIQQGDNKAA